jgi:hypothetical protein
MFLYLMVIPNSILKKRTLKKIFEYPKLLQALTKWRTQFFFNKLKKEINYFHFKKFTALAYFFYN